MSLDVESWVIGLASTSSVMATLTWLYANIHLPVLFGFVAAARLLAPDRYPRIRTTFVAVVRARGVRDRAVSARAPALAARARARRAAVGCRADEHDRRALPQHDGRRSEPALRLRGLRRRDRDLALSAVTAGMADTRVPRARLRRHRRHREPLRPRLRRRCADVRVRSSRRGRRARPRACACASPDERRREHRARIRADRLGVRLARSHGARQVGQPLPRCLILAAGIAAVVTPRLGQKEPLAESS